MSEIKSRTDIFEAAAKMMRMCDEAGITPHYKFEGKLFTCTPICGGEIALYEFPLAIVEGKPVFKGDELYDCYERKVKAEEYDSLYGLKTDGRWYELSSYSWLPPKPRTVMVELLREDAE